MAAKKVSLWARLPKEVKVGIYLVGSAALAELARYLEVVQIDNLYLAAVINLLVVLLQTRVPQIKAKLKK